MHLYKNATESARDKKGSSPSDELRIAVTFRPRDGGEGPTKYPAPLSTAAVERFVPDPLDMDKGLYELARLGFTPTQRGRLTASIRGSRRLFEQVFQTKLEKVELDRSHDYTFHSFYYPPQDAPWNPPPALTGLIDDAYIQWPHIYMARRATTTRRQRRPPSTGGDRSGPSVTPPSVDYYHLAMPYEVPTLLNATRIHRAGMTGQGVRIAMIDSGFAHDSHPFFTANGYRSTVDLAPHAADDRTDSNGHGTGESTNIFSVAPGATFIGIKLDNDEDPRNGASILEGFQTALAHQPHVISVSLGYDLRDPGTFKQMSELPGNLAALEAEILAAVARGIVVIFSAGNGHFSFPGMMPGIISAGGTFVDENGGLHASDYASAFDSKIYPGRHIPDFCGLVGMQPHASYIMLPIPPGCEIDRETSQPDDGQGDGTTPSDGWGVFSGTSAAAPQLAGVCALLLQKNPGLTPSDVKAVLRRTARTVTDGAANPSSSDDGIGMPAGPSDRGACGAGLVDAFAAWQQV